MTRVGRAAVQVDEGAEALAVGEEVTVPVGVGLPEGPATVAVRVKVWPGAGLAELEVSTTTGVSLLASEMMVPPLAAAAQPVAVAGVGGVEGQNSRRDIAEGDHRFEAGVAGCAKGLPGSGD